MIEFAEESQEWDARLFELLMDAIPPAREGGSSWTATTAPDIYRAMDEMRRSVLPEMSTWVVPPGCYVDPTIPVNVVESALVGPDHIVIIPVNAFDPHPWLDDE